MRLRALMLRRSPIVALAGVAAALAAATPGAGAPPALKQKEAEAKAVLAQVNALDIQLGRLDEQLNGARYELAQVHKREHVTLQKLQAARRQLAVAQAHAAQRLVALYESSPPSVTDAILGATNLSEMLDRLQVVDATGALDRRIARAAQARRNVLAVHERALAVEKQRQAAAVATIAAHEHTMSVELGQRRTLLASVQGEVKRLQAAEARRQARLVAEARARLAAEARARAEAEAAAARAAAARAAQAKKTAAPPAAATTTAATTPTAPPATTTEPAPTTSTDATTPAAPPPPVASGGHPEAATIALQYLGVPYVFGGSTPAGFDCSGLVMYVFAQLGIQLPHFAAAQYGYGTPVARGDLQPGDLVFFDGLGHVGIYIGGGQFVHAPHTGTFVRIESLSGWYASTYVGARRI
jgi:peptidoglycan DL-endopeptidase CwlO